MIRHVCIFGWVYVAVLIGGVPSVVCGQRDDGVDLRHTPVVRAFQRVRNSVVNISSTEHVVVQRKGLDLFGDVFSFPVERDAHSVGSGFVIHRDGYIATNAHVVSAGARLVVTFANGQQYDARVIGRDTRSDLAVIRIESGEVLKPIAFGTTDDLLIGEQTMAIGNPVGLQNTLTTGVVSALHRELNIDGRVLFRDVIQTDASINPGNSGGPLLNIYGELIGINTAVRTDAQNIGFAIPVDQLLDVLPELLDAEKLNRVQVGMRVSGMAPTRVTSVRQGGPAAKAGVQEGDVVVAIDGHPIARSVDFCVAMLGRGPGDVVDLSLLRRNRNTTAHLRLTEIPKPDGRKLARERMGLVVADTSQRAADHLRWRSRSARPGVLIVTIELDGPADRADLRPGDLLVSMGPHWLNGLEHVGTILGQVGRGEPIDVGFRRMIRGRLYDGEARIYAR